MLDRLIHLSKRLELSLKERMHVHAIMFELLAALVDGLANGKDDVEKISERTKKLAYRIAEEIEAQVKRPGAGEESFEDKVRIDDIARR